jgi:hypothetical protein
MSRQGPLKGPHRRAPKDSPYAGYAACLRCDQEFWSWDRRQNRLRPCCKNELDQEPSEEPRRPFHPPTRWTHEAMTVSVAIDPEALPQVAQGVCHIGRSAKVYCAPKGVGAVGSQRLASFTGFVSSAYAAIVPLAQ